MPKRQKLPALPLAGAAESAGLSIAETAYLLGVSRVTVHNWVAERSGPHRMLYQRVSRAVVFLKMMVTRKKLPMNDGLDSPARTQRLEKIKKAFDSFCIA